MGNVTNSLVAEITSQDDTSNAVPINFGTGNPAFDSITGAYTRYYLLGAGANAIPIIKSPCTCFYLKNLSSTQNVAVTWTGNGGGAVAVLTLSPGGQVLIWDNPAATGTAGITSLTLNPTAAATPVEYFMGG